MEQSHNGPEVVLLHPWSPFRPSDQPHLMPLTQLKPHISIVLLLVACSIASVHVRSPGLGRCHRLCQVQCLSDNFPTSTKSLMTFPTTIGSIAVTTLTLASSMSITNCSRLVFAGCKYRQPALNMAVNHMLGICTTYWASNPSSQRQEPTYHHRHPTAAANNKFLSICFFRKYPQ